MTSEHHKVNHWTTMKAAAVRIALKRLSREDIVKAIEFWDCVMTPRFDLKEHALTGNGPIRCVLCGEGTLPGGDMKLDNLGYCPVCRDITGNMCRALA